LKEYFKSFLFLAKASKNSSFQEPRSVSIHSLVSKLPVTAFPHHSWFHHFILRLRKEPRRFFEAYAKEAFGLRVILVVSVVVYILHNPHGFARN